MKVIIYGASVGILIECDISDEINCYSRKPKLYVYCKDTLKTLVFDTQRIQEKLDVKSTVKS